MAEETSDPRIARYVFAAVSASLIGAGLVRFAYTALLPALIDANWFSAASVRTLAAANLLGYLLGAISGRTLARYLTNVWTLRLMEVLAVVSLLACAGKPSLPWFFVCRVLSGVSGGAVVVIVAATVLPFVAPQRKGVASGLIFLGMGLGIVISGAIVPLFIGLGLRETWLALAAFCAVLTATTWTMWPKVVSTSPTIGQMPASSSPRVGIMYAEFALMAATPVAPMLFLAEYVSRELDLGGAAGSAGWLLYGVGATIGPPLYGFVIDKVGARIAVRAILATQAIGSIALLQGSSLVFLGTLALVLGTFVSGVVPLILGWLRAEMPGDVARQNLVWSRATIFYASTQTIGGYVFSMLLNENHGHHAVLFIVGACAAVVCLIINVVVWRRVA